MITRSRSQRRPRTQEIAEYRTLDVRRRFAVAFIVDIGS